MRRTPTDEGNFSATPSPVGNEGPFGADDDSLDDEIETLVCIFHTDSCSSHSINSPFLLFHRLCQPGKVLQSSKMVHLPTRNLHRRLPSVSRLPLTAS